MKKIQVELEKTELEFKTHHPQERKIDSCTPNQLKMNGKFMSNDSHIDHWLKRTPRKKENPVLSLTSV